MYGIFLKKIDKIISWILLPGLVIFVLKAPTFYFRSCEFLILLSNWILMVISWALFFWIGKNKLRQYIKKQVFFAVLPIAFLNLQFVISNAMPVYNYETFFDFIKLFLGRILMNITLFHFESMVSPIFSLIPSSGISYLMTNIAAVFLPFLYIFFAKGDKAEYEISCKRSPFLDI